MGEITQQNRESASFITSRVLIAGALVGLVMAFVDGQVGGLESGISAFSLGLGFGAGLTLALPWLLGILCVIGACSTTSWMKRLITRDENAALSGRTASVLSFMIWVLFGGYWGYELADSLNAFQRLNSEHRTLAQIAILVSVLGGLGLAGVAWLIQPLAQARGGLRLWSWGRPRWSIASALLLIGITLLVGERRVMENLYPSAHDAMRCVGVWSVSASLYLLSKNIRIDWRLLGACWVIGLSLLTYSFFALHTKDSEKNVAELANQERPLVVFALDIVRDITDIDRDGYSSFLGGGDCAPSDPLINPGAREILGNNIDENCLMGAAIKLDDSVRAVDYENKASDASIVLITVDTLRPDHMSVYGYERKTTPVLDTLTKDAMVFDRAYSSSAWTSLAISSMMRGVYPRRLEWIRVYETSKYRLLTDPSRDQLRKGERFRLTFTMPLKDPLMTIAERLKQHGMYTAAIVNDGYSEFLSAEMDAARGFDTFWTMDDEPKHRRHVAGTVSRALNLLKKMPEDQPFFLWVHIFGPHDPNTSHGGVPKFGSTIKDKYDHEIAYADKQVGRLLRRIRTLGKKRKIATLLTSDHGEKFVKKRRFHGGDLTEANIRVPLIVWAPWITPGRTDLLAGLVDVMPTMLAWAGAVPTHRMDGDDLTAYLLKKRTADQRVRLAETWRMSRKGKTTVDLVAAFDGECKTTYDRIRNTTVRSAQLIGADKNRDDPCSSAVEEALQIYREQSSGQIWSE